MVEDYGVTQGYNPPGEGGYEIGGLGMSPQVRSGALTANLGNLVNPVYLAVGAALQSPKLRAELASIPGVTASEDKSRLYLPNGQPINSGNILRLGLGTPIQDIDGNPMMMNYGQGAQIPIQVPWYVEGMQGVGMLDTTSSLLSSAASNAIGAIAAPFFPELGGMGIRGTATARGITSVTDPEFANHLGILYDGNMLLNGVVSGVGLLRRLGSRRELRDLTERLNGNGVQDAAEIMKVRDRLADIQQKVSGPLNNLAALAQIISTVTNGYQAIAVANQAVKQVRRGLPEYIQQVSETMNQFGMGGVYYPGTDLGLGGTAQDIRKLEELSMRLGLPTDVVAQMNQEQIQAALERSNIQVTYR